MSFVIEPISPAIKKKQKEAEFNKVALSKEAIIYMHSFYNGKIRKPSLTPLIGLQPSSSHPSFFWNKIYAQ